MKAAMLISLSLLFFSADALSLTLSQKYQILGGEYCCYSQETIDSVLEEHHVPKYNYPPQFDLNLPLLKEPASKFTWSVFYALQVLDVYTTERALQYNCVEELNPILGKKPTANDIIGLKVFLLAPALWYTNKHETITDEDLAGINYMMTAVVANNSEVWSEASSNCRKIR